MGRKTDRRRERQVGRSLDTPTDGLGYRHTKTENGQRDM